MGHNTGKYTKTGSWVERVLLCQMKKLNERGSAYIGPTNGKLAQMPYGDPEKPTAGTWVGKLVALAKDIDNEPIRRSHCWFVDAGSETIPCMPIGKGDTKKNWRVPRLLYGLFHSDFDLRIFNQNILMRHLCGHGWNGSAKRKKGKPGLRGRVCVNPYCLVPGTQAQNRDDSGCTYGSRATCPHVPKCRFTDLETGRPVPCLSHDDAVPVCECDVKCYPRESAHVEL